MMDTLRFVVYDGMYGIKETAQFKIPINTLRYKPDSLCKTWMTTKLIVPEEIADCYFPQVVLCEDTSRNQRNIDMQIECSVPKFLKGENLFSIREDKKQEFALKMSKALEKAGILVSPQNILRAPVRKLHIAHNMLTNFPVSIITDEISKADVWNYDPITEKDSFKNGGECYHIHHNSYELAFYNKITDIERLQSCTKHAIDGKEYPNLAAYQQYLKDQNRHILRMEYRINDVKYVKKEVNAILGNPPDRIVRVEDCFNNDLAKKILLNQWKKVEKACFQLPVYRRKSYQFWADIMALNPDKQDNHIWKAVYILQMIAEKGRVFVRNMLIDTYGKEKAKIMIKDALSFKFTRKKANYIAKIGRELKKFTPLTCEVLTKKVKKSIIKLNMDNTKFLTVDEMADILKVVPATIYRYLKAGKLTFYKFGKEYRVYEKDFTEFITSCKVAKRGGSK